MQKQRKGSQKISTQFGAESWLLLKRYTGWSDTSISEFCGNEGPQPGGGWLLQAEHKHVDLRLVETRRLITEIPGTSPHYLPTKQSESQTTYSSYPNLSLNTLPWNPWGSSSLLSMSCLFSLLNSCNKPASAPNSDVLVGLTHFAKVLKVETAQVHATWIPSPWKVTIIAKGKKHFCCSATLY